MCIHFSIAKQRRDSKREFDLPHLRIACYMQGLEKTHTDMSIVLFVQNYLSFQPLVQKTFEL